MRLVRERHDPHDSTPDSIARHRARYEKAIVLAERFGNDLKTWWDVACGYGYGTVLMPGDWSVGVDANPATINEAIVRHGTEAHFRVADVSQPGWYAGIVGAPDVVISVETLEHLDPFGQESFIRSVWHALGQGGVFVIACPLGAGRSATNPWHVHEPTEDELRRVLSAAGFDVAHFERHDYESTSGPAVQAFVVGVK